MEDITLDGPNRVMPLETLGPIVGDGDDGECEGMAHTLRCLCCIMHANTSLMLHTGHHGSMLLLKVERLVLVIYKH